MRLYETMLLIDPRLDDDAIDACVERFCTLVTERGGSTESIDKWGRRRLAYELSDLSEGYYAIVRYNLEPDHRQEIHDALPFLEGLVRSKTVRPEAKTRRP